MPRQVINLSVPEPRQIWQHVTSGVSLLILDVTRDGLAHCVLLNEVGTASPLQVMVPVPKFKHYGNRGLRLVGSRKYTLPAKRKAGVYNPRLLNLGAV